MRRRKVLLKNELSEMVFTDDRVKVSKCENEWFFEIGKEITSDIGEAVSILMRTYDSNHPIWNMTLNNVDLEIITPEKSLFWLTGGYSEWRSLEHYNTPWHDCYLDFQEEFGFLIMNIIKKSKTLGDIKSNFIKYLNLPVLYDFAISRDLVR